MKNQQYKFALCNLIWFCKVHKFRLSIKWITMKLDASRMCGYKVIDIWIEWKVQQQTFNESGYLERLDHLTTLPLLPKNACFIANLTAGWFSKYYVNYWFKKAVFIAWCGSDRHHYDEITCSL